MLMIKKIKNKKILVLTYWSFPGFENTDLSLVHILRTNKNFSVTYGVITEKLVEEDAKKKNLFSKFPCLPQNLRNTKEFINANTIWINKRIIFEELIKQNDVIIFGAFRGMDNLSLYIRSQNKIIISHQNPANLEQCFTKYLPNQLYVHNQILKKTYTNQIEKKTIKKIYNSDEIEVTGSLQYINKTKESHIEKIKLFKKYKLDLKKELIIFMPPSPQYLRTYVINSYRKVIKILSKKNYNLILKIHPTDRQKRKIFSYSKNKESWEIIDKNLIVMDESDFHNILKYAKFVISLGSTSFQDINILDKPIIFIDRWKNYFIKDEFHKSIKLSSDFYQNEYGVRKFMLDEEKLKLLIGSFGEEILDHTHFTLERLCYPVDLMKFYGLDADYDFLENIESFQDKVDLNNFKKLKLELGYEYNSNSLNNIYNSIVKHLYTKKDAYYEIIVAYIKIQFLICLIELKKLLKQMFKYFYNLRFIKL